MSTPITSSQPTTATDSLESAVLQAELRLRRIEVQRLETSLRKTIAERDLFRRQLERVYALRWTRWGSKLRVALKLARQSPTLIHLVSEDPRAAATQLKVTLRHPDQVRTLPRRLVALSERAQESTVGLSKRLRAEQRPDEALVAVDVALEADPRNPGLLSERSAVLLALGRLTDALANSRRLTELAPTPQNRSTERTIRGRLRELDPAWFPSMGWPRPSDYRATPGRVLHILKQSRPYHELGYTMRSHYALRSQLAAGFEPAALTSLGFPRLHGFADFDQVDVLDGIPHFRLDLGDAFPYAALPNDELITETTRLAARVVDRFAPSLIHINSGFRGFETALVGLALASHFGIPAIYDVRSFHEATWTPDQSRAQQGEHYERRLAKELACMRRADLVFTIAETMRANIQARGVDPDKIVVIPNAVDPEAFIPREPDLELKRDLGLDGRTLLGYISNIGRREGHDFLIEAVARMLPQRPNVGALIVGDGPEIGALRKLVSALGLDRSVKVVGHVPHDQIGRYYSIIDVFVIPRRDDEAARLVTPLKPFEAMAMARPLLVADLPALVEVANPPERGLSFVPEDAASLAAQAAVLCDHPDLRSQLGAAGRAWVTRERSWHRNGERYREAYGRLIDVPGAAG